MWLIVLFWRGRAEAEWLIIGYWPRWVFQPRGCSSVWGRCCWMKAAEEEKLCEAETHRHPVGTENVLHLPLTWTLSVPLSLSPVHGPFRVWTRWMWSLTRSGPVRAEQSRAGNVKSCWELNWFNLRKTDRRRSLLGPLKTWSCLCHAGEKAAVQTLFCLNNDSSLFVWMLKRVLMELDSGDTKVIWRFMKQKFSVTVNPLIQILWVLSETTSPHSIREKSSFCHKTEPCSERSVV